MALQNRKIVFIMTDTQRWDMCGCYRDTGLKTPNIDRLAAEGIRFERAYTTQPVCQPARAGIFTGQYPHSCNSWSNSMGIADNTHTLGERLQEEGIHTAYIGKWHLDGGDYFGTGKCPKGWDPAYWYDMRNYLEELTDQERMDSRRTERMLEKPVPPEFTYGWRCAQRAERFLEKHATEDFFLTVSFDEPHGPYLCPEPYASMYEGYCFPAGENVRDPLINKPDYQRVWAGKQLTEDRTELMVQNRFFFGCNSFVDSQIGRVIEAVERLAPDAVIMYTSDHGDFLESHRLCGKGPAAYDEISRIPFLIKGKEIPKGEVYPYPVSHINLTPTILELMGVKLPKVLDGVSLLPALENPAARVNDYVCIEFGRYEVDHDGFGAFQPLRAIFDGRYKLSVNLLSTDELYDLQTDPGETVNHINDPAYAAVRDQLHDALLDQMNRTRDPFRGYYWERRPWRTDVVKPTWGYTGLTRQREEEERYEKRQLDYDTGLPMTEAVRNK